MPQEEFTHPKDGMAFVKAVFYKDDPVFINSN